MLANNQGLNSGGYSLYNRSRASCDGKPSHRPWVHCECQWLELPGPAPAIARFTFLVISLLRLLLFGLEVLGRAAVMPRLSWGCPTYLIGDDSWFWLILVRLQMKYYMHMLILGKSGGRVRRVDPVVCQGSHWRGWHLSMVTMLISFVVMPGVRGLWRPWWCHAGWFPT